MRMYDLQEQIGGGGFADVWRAVCRDTGAAVAVKILRDYRNADARHRFEREVRMLQGLRHRRVIKLIEANVAAEKPFYVMPLMQGGALTAWAGLLPAPTARGMLAELVDFLVYLHDQGGLHRDIKPDNLLVDGAGEFAVGDFGLGNNPRYTVMMTAHAAGTWGYAAPELNRPGGRATAAADIYSLGATMFHLLTGIHPGQAASLDPWHVRHDVPVDLRNLVLQMVEQDPGRRPSARRLRGLLQAGQPAHNQHVAPAPQAQPSSSGSGFWEAVASVAGVALVIGFIAAVLDD